MARATLGRAYPRIIGANRERSWLFYDTVLPLLGTIAFVYVYKALGAPDRFVGYVIMGGATMAFWMNVMWNMAAQFYWDKQGGNLELYMVLPCGIVPILLGMSIGGFVGTLVRAAAIIVIGSVLFHVTYAITQLPLFLLIFAVGIIALYGLGVTFASVFLMWGREAWHMAELFMEPVFLDSGFYFPVRALGFWVGMGTSIIPLTLALVADSSGRVLVGLADREQLDRPAAVLHLFYRPAAGRRAHPRLHVPRSGPGRWRRDAGVLRGGHGLLAVCGAGHDGHGL